MRVCVVYRVACGEGWGEWGRFGVNSGGDRCVTETTDDGGGGVRREGGERVTWCECGGGGGGLGCVEWQGTQIHL